MSKFFDWRSAMLNDKRNSGSPFRVKTFKNIKFGKLVSVGDIWCVIKPSKEGSLLLVKVSEFAQSGFEPKKGQRLCFRTFSSASGQLSATDISLVKLEAVPCVTREKYLPGNSTSLVFIDDLGYGFIRPDDSKDPENIGVYVSLGILKEAGIDPQTFNSIRRYWIKTRRAKASGKLYVTQIRMA